MHLWERKREWVIVVHITIQIPVIMNCNTVNQAALILPVIVGGLRWTLITQKSALKVTYIINNVHLAGFHWQMQLVLLFSYLSQK